MVDAAFGAVEVGGRGTLLHELVQGSEVVMGVFRVGSGGHEVHEVAPGGEFEGLVEQGLGFSVLAFGEMEPGGEGEDSRFLGF